MSSVNTTPPSPSSEKSNPSSRPAFNTQNTQDRLRESDQRPSMFNSIKKNRKSVFREVGLANEDAGTISPRVVLRDPFDVENEKRDNTSAAGLSLLDTKAGDRGVTTPTPSTHHDPAKLDDDDETTSSSDGTTLSQPTGVGAAAVQSEPTSPQSTTSSKTPWYVKLTPTGRRARVRLGSGSSAPPSPFLGVSTMTMLALAVAIIAPTLLGTGGGQDALGVVDAGPIALRADSATDVCARWAQQSK